MYTVELCKPELIECLKKIMSQNSDVVDDGRNEVDLELSEVKFGNSFIIYMNEKRFNINFFTPIETARYIYNNIDKVTYIHCNCVFFDTLVGSISDFVIREFGFDECSDSYFIAMQLYEQYIRKSDTTLTLNNIISYIKDMI